MSNERASQEKQFKHIFGGRGEWKITKNGHEFKNISGSEKIKVSYKKKCVCHDVNPVQTLITKSIRN